MSLRHRLERLFSRVADEARPAAGGERWLQGFLAACSPAYGAGAVMQRLLHDAGALPRHRLRIPTISVGNITLGGTGKTPFTIWLGSWLLEDGRRPCILARGYGRSDEGRLLAVHDGRRQLAGTLAAGDEPVLIARTLGRAAVVVCSRRYLAGRFAQRRYGCDCAILDDGLQHLSLDRQCEIVLLDAARGLSGLRLFPRGTLREPLGVLRRAHLVVLTRCNQSRDVRRMVREAGRLAGGAPVVRTEVAVTGANRLSDGAALEADDLRGRKVMVVCGVARPASVRRSVEGLGARIVAFKGLPDHFRPGRDDLARWDAMRRRLGADYLVVTEKDAVKLAELGTLPDGLLALRMRLRFTDPGEEELARRTIRARMASIRVRGLLPRG